MSILKKANTCIALFSVSLKAKLRVDIMFDIVFTIQITFYILSIGYMYYLILSLITAYCYHFCIVIPRQKCSNINFTTLLQNIAYMSDLRGYLRLKYLLYLQTFQNNTYMLCRVNSCYYSTNGRYLLFLM